MNAAEKVCPKCSGELQHLPPFKHTGFLAYAGSEITFWVVAALVAGALSFVVDQKYDLHLICGGLAAIFVFIWLFRIGEKASRGPGLLYCKKCQYYRNPERAEGETGAI